MFDVTVIGKTGGVAAVPPVKVASARTFAFVMARYSAALCTPGSAVVLMSTSAVNDPVA